MKEAKKYKVVLDYSGDELKVEVSPPNKTLLEELAGSPKKVKEKPLPPRMGSFRGDSPLDD